MPANYKVKLIMSAREREDFFNRLREEKQLTRARIQEIFEEMTGEPIGGKAATSARKLFERHLQQLRRGQEETDRIMKVIADGSDPLDAARAMAKQQLFDELTRGEDIDLNVVTRIIARLSSSDTQVKRLQAQLDELERKNREREEKMKATLDKSKRKGGITPEALEEIESLLNMM